jgi:hypothetical protein
MENIFTTSQSEDYNNINTDNSITDSPRSSTSYVASEASIGYGDMKGGGEEEQVKDKVDNPTNINDDITTHYAIKAAENVNNVTESIIDWGENKLLELITSFSDEKLKTLLNGNRSVKDKIEKALGKNTEESDNKQTGGNKNYKRYYQKYIKYKLKYLSAKYE